MKSGATESSFYYLSQYYQFPNNVEVSRSIEILSQSNKQYKILWAHDNCDQPQLARLPELVSQIDLIVCVSKWEKEQYIKYNRAPEEKIVVIPNGVADIFNLKTPKSKTAIYFSGPHKGIAPLPKIWKQVIKNHPDAKLKVFSSHNLYGEQYEQHFKIPEHLEAIEELKSLPGVEYSPCVDREDLLPHIQDAAFFVHPNVWEETFCVSMAEAMVCGCYPITSDIGALSEISFNRGKYIPMLGTNTPVGWDPSPKFINEFAQELSRCFEFFDNQPETFYTATKELSQIAKETYDWKKIATYWEQLINTITDQTDHEVSPNDDKLNVKTEVTNNSEEYLSWFSSVNCLPPRHIGYLYKLKYKDDIEPKVVYDIGANCLHWYNQAKECWDNAEYYLMDGTKHFEFLYKRSGRKYSTDVLSDVDGKNVTYYENIQMSGGNSYYELNYKDFPENTIPFKNQHYTETQRITRSLDSIVRENNWKKPDLIKMDVQGAELDILRGAKETLKTCDHLILELQTKEFMKGAPMLQEVVEYLKTFGYELESNICISPVQGVDGDYHFVKKK